MKRLPLVLLFGLVFFLILTNSVLADCNPPDDYSSCPEQSPDYNLQVRGYQGLSGYLGLIDFRHQGDPSAPQLNTLLENNSRPGVVSLSQVYNWDWGSNSRGNLWQRPPDLPAQFDFATFLIVNRIGNKFIVAVYKISAN